MNKTLKKGEYLLLKGNGIRGQVAPILITSGAVVATTSTDVDKNESIVFVASEGVVVEDSRYDYRAITEVTFVPNPEPMQMELGIWRRRNAIESYSCSCRHLLAEDRIAHFLFTSFCLYGEDLGSNRFLKFTISHEDIAASCITTRVTVTKTLSRLKSRGLIGLSPSTHRMYLTLKGISYFKESYS